MCMGLIISIHKIWQAISTQDTNKVYYFLALIPYFIVQLWIGLKSNLYGFCMSFVGWFLIHVYFLYCLNDLKIWKWNNSLSFIVNIILINRS